MRTTLDVVSWPLRTDVYSMPLLLQDKPVPLSDQRALGYTKLFVYRSNPDCHHKVVIDVSEFPMK
jgi:hypothetical protein